MKKQMYAVILGLALIASLTFTSCGDVVDDTLGTVTIENKTTSRVINEISFYEVLSRGMAENPTKTYHNRDYCGNDRNCKATHDNRNMPINAGEGVSISVDPDRKWFVMIMLDGSEADFYPGTPLTTEGFMVEEGKTIRLILNTTLGGTTFELP